MENNEHLEEDLSMSLALRTVVAAFQQMQKENTNQKIRLKEMEERENEIIQKMAKREKIMNKRIKEINKKIDALINAVMSIKDESKKNLTTNNVALKNNP